MRRCKCNHLIMNGEIKNLGDNVLVGGKHYKLRKVKIGKDYIKCEDIKDFPLGKIKIQNMQFNNKMINSYASLRTNVESGYSAKSFPNHILEFYKFDNGYRLQTSPMVGVSFLPSGK